MIYTSVNGMKISKIALRCADLGSVVSAEDSFQLMDIFFENGGNVFDTGRVYCEWMEGCANKSESTLGEWVKSRNVRSEVCLATKGGHPPCGNHHMSRINAQELNKDIEESLRYLQTDYIDVYYLHRDDPQKPVSEIMPILDKFVKDGKARFIGASNWTAKRIEEANKFAEENGLAKFTFSEIMWSYAKVNKESERDNTLVIMDDEELSWYKKNDIIVMSFSSQAQGFYTTVKEQGLKALPPHIHAKYVNSVNLERLKKVARISEETGISPTAVGLNHLLQNKEINTVPIIGGYNKAFLLDSLRSLELDEKYFEQLKD